MENVIDAEYLAHQRKWSIEIFGPGNRTDGVINHIRKELKEIEEDPLDIFEWVDVLILAFDGAWRAGWEPQEIIDAIKTKQKLNETRVWPDWTLFTEGQAIEHIKEDWSAGDAYMRHAGYYPRNEDADPGWPPQDS